jgi:antitoxin (DNA-binding transcriptional repressor) of toxin-antitoxin stability system
MRLSIRRARDNALRGDQFMKYVDRFVFKARCSAILTELQATGESVVVTKDGKPYVRLEPIRAQSAAEVSRTKKTVRQNRKTKG